MPALSAKQYGLAQAVRTRRSHKMPMHVAEEMISKTSSKKRSKFAKTNAKKRYTKAKLRSKLHEMVKKS